MMTQTLNMERIYDQPKTLLEGKEGFARRQRKGRKRKEKKERKKEKIKRKRSRMRTKGNHGK